MLRRLALPALLALGLLHGCGGESAPAKTFIDGTVTNSSGAPEAGVWVIAETTELATPFRKIVVTDDAGRFLVPELPEASYALWVRGYGLRDSAKRTVRLGQSVDLTVSAAASPQQAAQIYPANHWLSLLKPPAQSGWASTFKLGCQLCHQVGTALTRSLDRDGFSAGLLKATHMNATADYLGREALLEALSAWSQQVRDGAVPPAPARPQGLERNLVLTQWEWGDGFTYAHDEIATDKRAPTLNSHGPIYGVDLANDRLLTLDPLSHTAGATAVPTRGGFDTPWCNQSYQGAMLGTGDAVIPMGFGSLGCGVSPGVSAHEGRYHNPANPHNPMMDGQGRVWMTTQIRREWDEDLPAFCEKGEGVAGRYHHRQLGVFDPESQETTLIDTCYGTHHLQFDDKGVLWLSGDVFVIGWFDPAKFDPARPESEGEAQGWAVPKIDTTGDGEADETLVGFNYGIIPNPVDGSVWTAQPGASPGDALDYPGRLVLFDPATGGFDAYRPPFPGAGPRGVDVDRDGILWVALGGSGHLGRFDRSQCAQTWGPGDQCPEGWTLYPSPGPNFGADGALGADFHYYLFVDQFDTLGLGADTVILNGTGSDALLAFDQATERFTVLRIPYPLNTFTRGLDGRIDDPEGGWKGRGLWFTNGTDPVLHSEVPRSYVGKVQLRPHPLAP